jgi:hypothetical protein
VDRLTAWVQGLPGPAWPYYLGFALVFSLARTVAAWSDGSHDVGTIFPLHIVLVSTSPYLLLVLHYLDDRAGAALAAFRPVLNVDSAGYERLRYQLTTMPAGPALAWTLAGLLVGVGVASGLLFPAAALSRLSLFTSPVTTVMDYIGVPLSWLLIPVTIYHTIRQLRLVSRIYTRHTNVNIFDTGPLYALSRVAAITAVALLLGSYAYQSVTSDRPFQSIAANVGSAGTTSFVLVAAAAFVWPLFGAHRLLQEDKARRKSEVARQMEVVTGELHRRTAARDFGDMANLNDAIDSLIKERGVLDRASTWPWEPESLRAVVTALLLPVALWIVTRALERLGF